MKVVHTLLVTLAAFLVAAIVGFAVQHFQQSALEDKITQSLARERLQQAALVGHQQAVQEFVDAAKKESVVLQMQDGSSLQCKCQTAAAPVSKEPKEK